MLEKLRGSDSLVRWGGEEFVVIMPDTDIEQAQIAMRRMVEDGLGFRPDGQPLTASIGLAERCFDCVEDQRQLLELADQRMYLAKSEGRNRLCTADAPLGANA